MTEDAYRAGQDQFVNDDGDVLTRSQIGYGGWKGGLEVERDGDDYIVNGIRYKPKE
ncbi:hypothetical protein [Haloarchaeobius sp. HRN-SO-5]|uniref:hypothetical protein n=1 Tax=Haloarchaeobius sp. HRN-SO-5 TaxID=3446118 RepID=UPI003EBD4A85